MNKFLSLLVFAVVLSSCGSSKNTSHSKRIPVPNIPIVKTDNKAVNKEIDKLKKRKSSLDTRTIAYISHYAVISMEEMKKHKIPASITLAQGILESGNGLSQLALKSNNHFGVKCHKGWKGSSVRHDDDEAQECFSKYKHVETSYRDHSDFLRTRSRYDFLFKLKKDDYKGWAKGLKKAGYATDKRYPDKLIHLIETYELYNYDKIVLRKKIDAPKKSRYRMHRVRKGETLYSISKKYKTTVEQLKSWNNLDSNTISIHQELRVK